MRRRDRREEEPVRAVWYDLPLADAAEAHERVDAGARRRDLLAVS